MIKPSDIKALLPIVLFLAPLLYAGDEDMSPSAYQIFDPETGFTITVDPNADDHNAAAQDHGLSTDTAVAPATSDSADGSSSSSGSTLLWIAVVAAALLIAVVAAWKRVRR